MKSSVSKSGECAPGCDYPITGYHAKRGGKVLCRLFLSYPRLRIYKSTYPNVGWLIVLYTTQTNTWLVARFATGAIALSKLEDTEWLRLVLKGQWRTLIVNLA